MNERLFRRNSLRKNIFIEPMWNFHTLDENNNKIEAFQMLVPSCWESNPNLSSYKGKGIYTKKIIFGGNVRLIFKGVSHTANIYLDGKHIGYHYNGYTEFDIVLKNISYTEHIVELIVDNSFHEESALHVSNDYYSYGGITRPIIFEQIDELYIKNVHFIPNKENGKWTCKITAKISNITDQLKVATLKVKIGNTYLMNLKNVEILPNKVCEFNGTYEFDEIEEYTLDNPKLYEIKSVLEYQGNEIDDLFDRVGFRTIEVVGKDILFNGEKIIVKGVNRHEDYAEFGCAVPIEAMYRDIELIKRLGANCIRTCHYPNDERFLDLCDENGILVWEESHARGLNEEQMKHKNFEEQSLNCIYEMIENHINHPSIFIWGILNECVSNTEFGRSCYEKQFSLIRKLDSSRPVSYASLEAYIGSDLSLDLVDIVSYNIYPKWYHEDTTCDCLKKLKDFVATTGGAGKPILISEIGGGAIYGYRSNNLEKWTEDYQEILLEEQLTAILQDVELSGVIVWQYSDCRVDPGWFGIRPKSQNNKGLVDIYRREKLAYKKVKEIFSKVM